MKTVAYTIILLFSSFYSFSQVGIGTTSPDPSSILHIQPTTDDKGVLIPRLDSSDEAGITLPANGLIIYNTDLNNFRFNEGTPGTPNWVNITFTPSIKYSNTNTTTNVNPTTTPIHVPLLGTLDWNDNPALYSVNTTNHEITVNQDGRYRITVNVSLSTTSTADRLTPEMWIEIGGTQRGTFGGTGYIRTHSGHQESSINITEVFNLAASNVISVGIVRTGGNGTVNLRSAGSSNILIEKIN